MMIFIEFKLNLPCAKKYYLHIHFFNSFKQQFCTAVLQIADTY